LSDYDEEDYYDEEDDIEDVDIERKRKELEEKMKE